MKKLIITTILILTIISLNAQVKATKINDTIPFYALFKLEIPNYDSALQATRKAVNVNGLVRDKGLDSIAYLRCLRMAKILVKSNDLLKDFSIQAHKENLTYENTSFGEARGIWKEAIDTLSGKNLISILHRHKTLCNEETDLGLDLNNGYNKSPGHYRNRTNAKYNKYGTCTIVFIFHGKNPHYDEFIKSGRKGVMMEFHARIIIINYECFEL